jgi:predicted DNA-binding transcriptional regulator AlpA
VDGDDLLTTNDLAARLKISKSSALRLMQSDSFPVINVAPPTSTRAAWRVRVRDIEAWMRFRTYPE